MRADSPLIKEQTEITHRAEELLGFAERIEQGVAAAQQQVNRLTQSLLAKAFRGELTADWRAQKSDLNSGPNFAQSKLERIKGARTRLSLNKRRAGKLRRKAAVL